MLVFIYYYPCTFFFSSRRRHTRSALLTGVQTCALPIFAAVALDRRPELAEWIDAPLLASRNWPAWREAMERAHASPRDEAAREIGRASCRDRVCQYV